MKHLKRTLALALCLVMALSVLVIGAGAAFSDQSAIENTEAVNACTALKIINGYPDGSFRPANGVTRAEMAKMVSFLCNGGKEPDIKPADPIFTDVRGVASWAEKYIVYCCSQDITQGIGYAKFNPNGSVTGLQAAKMLLVCLGHDPKQDGYTGSTWSVNVAIDAEKAGLFKGWSKSDDPSAPLSRDQAAGLIWCALNATEVTYVSQEITDENGKTATQVTCVEKTVDGKPLTLIQDKYGVDAPPGIEYPYGFQFSDRYDERISSDFSLTFPAEISTGLRDNTLSLLECYQNETAPDREAVQSGDGMVPHMYKDYCYFFGGTSQLRVETDFYEPDGVEYVTYVWTNFKGVKTDLGVGVGSSERELLSAYTDNLYYLDDGQVEPISFSLDESSGFEFDCAYAWQPFTAETNEIRDITFYLRDGIVSAIEMTEPFELRYVYGYDREAGLQFTNEKRAELS